MGREKERIAKRLEKNPAVECRSGKENKFTFHF